MTRAAVGLFSTPHTPRSASAPKKNRDPAGYGSWERPIEEQVVQAMVCNTFGQSFYADAKTLAEETEKVMDTMLAKDSKFFAKALVYSREKGFMRTAPILGLVKLFSVDRDSAKKVFQRIIRTPNDLADFTAILKAKRNSEGGRAVKRAAGDWLVQKLGAISKDGEADGQYWAMKYGADKSEGAYSLKDMIQVYHPRVPGNRRLPLFDYIMGGRRLEGSKKGERSMDLMNFAELPQLEQFELLKRATSDDEKVQAIAVGGIPHEVATSFAGTSKKVWNAIVPNLPIFALLRNLATLERHGVLDDNKKIIQGMFSNPDVIRKSMIFPFRFMEADRHVSTNWVKDCLRDGVELSFANLPDIEGRTAVAMDTSGSMGSPISTNSQVSCISVAALFGMSLMKKTNGNGRLIGFDHDAREIPFSMRDSILTQAQRVANPGGGTNHSAALKLLGSDKVDNIVYITDEQQNSGTPLIDAFDAYKRRVNKDVKLFIVDLSNYRNALTPTDPNMFYMYGWSDAALNFISQTSKGWNTMTESIRKIEL